MSTYAHVTVTVVLDGVTTTYDIPRVEDFRIEDDSPAPHMDAFGYLHPRPRTISFRMRPLPLGDDGTLYTHTQDA